MNPDHSRFQQAVSSATDQEQVFAALCDLTRASVGAKLFTLTTIDTDAGLARRAYSSDPVSYPVSGTKPIQRTDWFASVHDRHETFVANTLDEIAEVFPDHALIGRLGCQSVVNLPVPVAGKVAATVNILHEEHYFTDDRVERIERELRLPALVSVSLSHLLNNR